MCHQNPEILLSAGGEAIPLCPRCIGLHLGFLAATAVLLSIGWRRGWASWRVWPWLAIASAGALALDWGAGQLGMRLPTAGSRLFTGAACGTALAPIVLAYVFGSPLKAEGPARSGRRALSAGRTGRRRGALAIPILSLSAVFIFTRVHVPGVALAIVTLSVLANVVIAILCFARIARSRWVERRSTTGGVR